MFVRIKTVQANGKSYAYVHIVETHRDGKRVRQRIVASLGRLDELQAKGDLLRVIEGLVEQCPQIKLIRAQQERSLTPESDRVLGPVLVFERLWEELELPALFQRLRRGRRFEFDIERCAFALCLQRILAPGSDLAGSKWTETIEARGFEALRLPHFYRTVGQLWRWREKIEEHLYQRGLHLFNRGMDIVFFDTTSTYFEGTSWKGWAKLGKSRDGRPDHLQLVIAVVMRRDGIPVSCEIWPGNMADVKTLKPTIESLKRRFEIEDVILVCDRGMVSRANLQELEANGYGYIVGMRTRTVLEVRERVLRRAGRYREVQHNLHVKEVWVDDRRYVVCSNPERADKDRHDREAILKKLREKLASGSGSRLIPNRGYRRFLKRASRGLQVDEEKIETDARYDGKYVLRTNTNLPAHEVAIAYKHLTWIERLWRELKDVMEVRPIFHHKKKENVKGHIFASFLALYLTCMLRHRLDALAKSEAAARSDPLPQQATADPPRLPVPWDDLLRDLSQTRAIRIRLDDQRYLMRTELRGLASVAFKAVGLRPPPLAQPIAD